MDMREMLGQVVMNTAKAMESQIDDQLDSMKNIDDMEALRAKRLMELRMQEQNRAKYISLGHGRMTDIADEREFFPEAKKSERIILHFYRPGNRYADMLDEHLRKLAPQHFETRFMRANAEACPFLTERLRIQVLPSLVLIKQGKVDYIIAGMDEIGGERTTTQRVEWVLGQHTIINKPEAEPDEDEERD
ncbi:putative Thioredoxin domain [Paratrimastix pyriformis]|uniref:Thioredoxin domain n=1 Tax=Paratrimastix pyriformis TaxID=342808 RepID=A0ABQ8UDM0_9EUKA|nr:putative Thioredoxin domain [Paratrimastix pyriformis]